MCIRDIGRVMNVSLADVDNISKIIGSRKDKLSDLIKSDIRLQTLIEDDNKIKKLMEVAVKVEGIKRIRLGSLEPTLITEEFVKRLSKISKICDQFHLSLQSGCNETLKRMNRKYTVEQFKKGANLLRSAFPNVNLTTDIIVGFPRRNRRRV